MFRKLTLIASFAALALSGNAAAQSALPEGSTPAARADVPVPARMAMHVHAMVMEDLKQYITSDATLGSVFLRMVLLSKQESLALSCAAYNLDQKAMLNTMMRTMRPLSEGVASDVAQSNLSRTLRQYNTLLGGELAQFAYDPTGYCDYGKTLMADLSGYPPNESVLVIKAAN